MEKNFDTPIRNMTIFKKDKFLYSTPRKKVTKNTLVTVIAIACAFILSLLLVMILYNDGSLFSSILVQIFTTPFNSANWKMSIASITIFLVSALSFIFANKAGMFNIGISGQMLCGAQIAIILAWCMPNIPNVLGQILVIFIAIIGGTVIALIIGALKIYWNINEVISSIMFNWIIFFVGTYLINYVGTAMNQIQSSGLYTVPLSDNLALLINFKGSTESVLEGAWLPLLIIASIVLILSIVILNWLTFGKKIACSGKGPDASLYFGMNVKANQLITIGISGALAGLLGAMLYCGQNNSINVTIATKAIPAEGFNGIAVGLIAMNNPVATLPVSMLFGMVQNAKSSIQQVCSVDPNITDLMFGIVVYGAAIVALFYKLKPWIWIKQMMYGKKSSAIYQTYLGDLENEVEYASTAIFYIKRIHLLKIKMNKLNQKVDDLKKGLSVEQIKTIDEYIKHYDEIMDFSYSMVLIGDRTFKITISSEQKQEAARKLQSSYKDMDLNISQKLLVLTNKIKIMSKTIELETNMTQVKNVLTKYHIEIDKLLSKEYFYKCRQSIYGLYRVNKTLRKVLFLNKVGLKNNEDFVKKYFRVYASEYSQSISNNLKLIAEKYESAYVDLLNKSTTINSKNMTFKTLNYENANEKLDPKLNKKEISLINTTANRQISSNNMKLNKEKEKISAANALIAKTKIDKTLNEEQKEKILIEQNNIIKTCNDTIHQLSDYNVQLNQIDDIIKHQQLNSYKIAASKIKSNLTLGLYDEINNQLGKELSE